MGLRVPLPDRRFHQNTLRPGLLSGRGRLLRTAGAMAGLPTTPPRASSPAGFGGLGIPREEHTLRSWIARVMMLCIGKSRMPANDPVSLPTRLNWGSDVRGEF